MPQRYILLQNRSTHRRRSLSTDRSRTRDMTEELPTKLDVSGPHGPGGQRSCKECPQLLSERLRRNLSIISSCNPARIFRPGTHPGLRTSKGPDNRRYRDETREIRRPGSHVEELFSVLAALSLLPPQGSHRSGQQQANSDRRAKEDDRRLEGFDNHLHTGVGPDVVNMSLTLPPSVNQWGTLSSPPFRPFPSMSAKHWSFDPTSQKALAIVSKCFAFRDRKRAYLEGTREVLPPSRSQSPRLSMRELRKPLLEYFAFNQETHSTLEEGPPRSLKTLRRSMIIFENPSFG